MWGRALGDTTFSCVDIFLNVGWCAGPGGYRFLRYSTQLNLNEFKILLNNNSTTSTRAL